jgi:hypothetical protein
MGMTMFITVLAIICLNVAVPGTCLTEPVVNSNQEQLTMGGCLGLLGFESAKEFWEHHPLYHTWKFKGWACQFGNRAPPEHGKALPALQCADANPRVRRGNQKEAAAPAVLLYAVVLLHEQELSHDADHARSLQGHEPGNSLTACLCHSHAFSPASFLPRQLGSHNRHCLVANSNF